MLLKNQIEKEKIKRGEEKSYAILKGVMIFLIFLLGYLLGRLGFNASFKDGDFKFIFKGRLYPEEKTINFEIFWDVWKTLNLHYVEKNIDQAKLFDGAIKGMVSSLNDIGTRYLNAEDTKQYEQSKSGSLEGIGIYLGYDDNKVIIKKIFENSPAENSGLKVGDTFVKIDGNDVSNLDAGQIAEKIRGKSGTVVKLEVARNGNEKNLQFSIQRSSVKIKSISWEMRDDGIVVISVLRFTEQSYEEFASVWDKVANEVKAKNPKGIIIDLRDNGGGFLDGAVHLASSFIEEGKPVLYTSNRNGDIVPLNTTKAQEFLNVKVVILVNEDTASASEIFAGAMKYYKRAKIVGTQTFGKGTAQEILAPANWNGASLHITVQKWLLPDKSWINSNNKINPDIKVENTVSEIKEGKDKQMDKALEILKN